MLSNIFLYTILMYPMVEPIINNWTIEHLLFGLGTAIVITLLNRSKHRVVVISCFIIVLWELFEYRNSPSYWLTNYVNNLADIAVGVAGIIIIHGLNHFYKLKKK